MLLHVELERKVGQLKRVVKQRLHIPCAIHTHCLCVYLMHLFHPLGIAIDGREGDLP